MERSLAVASGLVALNDQLLSLVEATADRADRAQAALDLAAAQRDAADAEVARLRGAGPAPELLAVATAALHLEESRGSLISPASAVATQRELRAALDAAWLAGVLPRRPPIAKGRLDKPRPSEPATVVGVEVGENFPRKPWWPGRPGDAQQAEVAAELVRQSFEADPDVEAGSVRVTVGPMLPEPAAQGGQ